jgi:hypothetical protein
MYQSRTYRLFFKKLTDLAGAAISSTQLRVNSFTLKRDKLTKTTSRFEVLEVPSAVEMGDVVGMYNSFGSIVFLGIVSLVDNSSVEAEQIYSLFDDDWLWNRPSTASIEGCLEDILNNDFVNNRDTLMQQIFGAFDISTISTTAQTLESQEEQYVTNFASFLYDIYEKYSVELMVSVPFEAERPTIEIGKPTYTRLKIGNNALIFRNFDIVREVFETNKLVVYSEETGDYRGEWFTTPSGITDNPAALNRIAKVKTNIVFSDDDISILKASSLRNEIYNHKITCEIVANNQLLPPEDLKLGQGCDLYYNGLYFDTILTGYEYSMQNGIEDDVLKLTFGLVRTSLTEKLFKRLT